MDPFTALYAVPCGTPFARLQGPLWYANHPVVPALATALRPIRKIMASVGDDLPPDTAGAPALTASIAAV